MSRTAVRRMNARNSDNVDRLLASDKEQVDEGEVNRNYSADASRRTAAVNQLTKLLGD